MSVKISKAYCWEMQKIADAYQVRVAFFSNENTYKEFHFYCMHCGLPLEGRLITTHRDLDLKKSRTPSFATWKGRRHKATCPVDNPLSVQSENSVSRLPVFENDFYFTHLLLSSMNTGIVGNVPAAPDELEEDNLLNVDVLETNYTVYQTSIFKDIVDCYHEILSKNLQNIIKLKIEDSIYDTTYLQVFKSIKNIGDYFTKGENSIKYKIYYAEILNNKTKEEDVKSWSFYVKEPLFWINEERVKKSSLIKIVLPLNILTENIQMKKYIDMEQEKGKTLDKCYLVNSKPSFPVSISNKSGNGNHFESQIIISDMNHIVLTFKL